MLLTKIVWRNTSNLNFMINPTPLHHAVLYTQSKFKYKKLCKTNYTTTLFAVIL